MNIQNIRHTATSELVDAIHLALTDPEVCEILRDERVGADTEVLVDLANPETFYGLDPETDEYARVGDAVNVVYLLFNSNSLHPERQIIADSVRSAWDFALDRGASDRKQWSAF